MTGDGSQADDTDAQLVAVFEGLRLAEAARAALLSAGIPPGSIELVGQADPAPAESPQAETGFWAAVGRLFAPNDEAHELSQAVGRGHVMVVVHPADPAEREIAIEALEGCGPLDLDERRIGLAADQPAAYEPGAEPATEAATAHQEPARAHMVRIVEERMRVGWRDHPEAPGRVRQYLAPKPQTGPQDRRRVELQEDEIGQPGDPATRP